MSHLRRGVIFGVVVVLLCSIFTSTIVASDAEDLANAAVEGAEAEVFSAYQAVRAAEMAGADVSGFSELLRDGTQLLAQAHTAFRVGDFDGAVRFAALAGEIGSEVTVKAVRLREVQLGLPLWHMWLTMVQSLLGVMVVGFASFWSWGVFKRLYYRRLRGMTPKVRLDGS